MRLSIEKGNKYPSNYTCHLECYLFFCNYGILLNQCGSCCNICAQQLADYTLLEETPFCFYKSIKFQAQIRNQCVKKCKTRQILVSCLNL